jgi:hypothetical protein
MYDNPQKTPSPILFDPNVGSAGGDHDQPYQYRKPSAASAFPFRVVEFSRLMRLRADVSDGKLGLGRFAREFVADE